MGQTAAVRLERAVLCKRPAAARDRTNSARAKVFNRLTKISLTAEWESSLRHGPARR
jgi:hypothetical protein